MDKILKKDENDVDAKRLMALCFLNTEKYEEARSELEDVIKYRQDDALCWYYLACCYDNLGALIEAKHAYHKVIDLRKEYIDAYKSLAIIYIKLEDTDSAVKICEKGLEIEDDDYSLYYIAGTACMAARNFEGSVKYIKK